jgi:hypothetical protein
MLDSYGLWNDAVRQMPDVRRYAESMLHTFTGKDLKDIREIKTNKVGIASVKLAGAAMLLVGVAMPAAALVGLAAKTILLFAASLSLIALGLHVSFIGHHVLLRVKAEEASAPHLPENASEDDVSADGHVTPPVSSDVSPHEGAGASSSDSAALPQQTNPVDNETPKPKAAEEVSPNKPGRCGAFCSIL